MKKLAHTRNSINKENLKIIRGEGMFGYFLLVAGHFVGLSGLFYSLDVIIGLMKQFQSVVYKEGKYFVAQCLDIDVSSFGKTEKEALDNLKEADASKVKSAQNPKIKTFQLQSA